jgi:hypothetical protein
MRNASWPHCPLCTTPCCREKGISVVDMGLVHDVSVTDLLSESARSTLRFLPDPVAVGDRDGYIAAHTQERSPGGDR